MKEFKISSRLLKCAEEVSGNARIADIGTDHAYIPIYLALKDKISYALAVDINPGPLDNAKTNIKKYNLDNIIETRLSDGLENVNHDEIDEIIIAGMGGNTIKKILQNCRWTNKKSKKFILQPMKYENNLRIYLAGAGYTILKEKAVICAGKVYTVISSAFTGITRVLSAEEIYIGNLGASLDEAAGKYIEKQIKSLQKLRKGAHLEKMYNQEKNYSEIIKSLENLLRV